MKENRTNKTENQAESKRGQQPSRINSEKTEVKTAPVCNGKTLEEWMTPAQLDRLRCDWAKFAGEPLTTYVIGDNVIAFGSELACLRLAFRFRHTPVPIRMEFSKNLDIWYFCLYDGKV